MRTPEILRVANQASPEVSIDIGAAARLIDGYHAVRVLESKTRPSHETRTDFEGGRLSSSEVLAGCFLTVGRSLRDELASTSTIPDPLAPTPLSQRHRLSFFWRLESEQAPRSGAEPKGVAGRTTTRTLEMWGIGPGHIEDIGPIFTEAEVQAVEMEERCLQSGDGAFNIHCLVISASVFRGVDPVGAGRPDRALALKNEWLLRAGPEGDDRCIVYAVAAAHSCLLKRIKKSMTCAVATGSAPTKPTAYEDIKIPKPALNAIKKDMRRGGGKGSTGYVTVLWDPAVKILAPELQDTPAQLLPLHIAQDQDRMLEAYTTAHKCGIAVLDFESLGWSTYGTGEVATDFICVLRSGKPGKKQHLTAIVDPIQYCLYLDNVKASHLGDDTAKMRGAYTFCVPCLTSGYPAVHDHKTKSGCFSPRCPCCYSPACGGAKALARPPAESSPPLLDEVELEDEDYDWGTIEEEEEAEEEAEEEETPSWFSCPTCLMQAHDERCLQTHTASRCLVKVKEFACERCDRGFPSEKKLGEHTALGDCSLFICRVCDLPARRDGTHFDCLKWRPGKIFAPRMFPSSKQLTTEEAERGTDLVECEGDTIGEDDEDDAEDEDDDDDSKRSKKRKVKKRSGRHADIAKRAHDLGHVQVRFIRTVPSVVRLPHPFHSHRYVDRGGLSVFDLETCQDLVTCATAVALDPLWRREPGVSDLYPPAPPLRLRDWDRHELVEVEAAEGASELTTVIEHRHGAWLGVVFLRRRDAFAPVVRRRLLAAHRLREGGREQGLDDEGDVEDAVAEEMQAALEGDLPTLQPGANYACDPLREVLLWLTAHRFEGFVAWSHNGSHYDMRLAYNGICEIQSSCNHFDKRPVGMVGSLQDIKQLSVRPAAAERDIIFADSLLHLGTSVAKLAETYELDVGKGEHPVFFDPSAHGFMLYRRMPPLETFLWKQRVDIAFRTDHFIEADRHSGAWCGGTEAFERVFEDYVRSSGPAKRAKDYGAFAERLAAAHLEAHGTTLPPAPTTLKAVKASDEAAHEACAVWAALSLPRPGCWTPQDWDHDESIVGYCFLDTSIVLVSLLKYQQTQSNSYAKLGAVINPLASITGPSANYAAMMALPTYQASEYRLPMTTKIGSRRSTSNQEHAFVTVMQRRLRREAGSAASDVPHQLRSAFHPGGQYLMPGTQKHYLDLAWPNRCMAFNFHGCFWHGHECDLGKGGKDDPDFILRRDRALTVDRVLAHKAQVEGWTYTPYFECAFLRGLEPDETELFESVLEGHRLTGRRAKDLPILGRSGMFGGRVEPYFTYLDVKMFDPAALAAVLDVGSLYPSVMVQARMPVLRRIRGGKDNSEAVDHTSLPITMTPLSHGSEFERMVETNCLKDGDGEGIVGKVRCVVRAPRDLEIPMLPISHGEDADKRIGYPLCRTCFTEACVAAAGPKCGRKPACGSCAQCACAAKRRAGEPGCGDRANCLPCAVIDPTWVRPSCAHRDGQRDLHGIWATPELVAALRSGYHLVEVLEVLHYPCTSTEMFKPYMSGHIRPKFTASKVPPKHMAADGLPTEDWVEVQNELFRKQFGEYHREFRRDEFKYNPALRNACKPPVNTPWGYMAQDTLRKEYTRFNAKTQYREFVECMSTMERKSIEYYPDDCGHSYVVHTKEARESERIRANTSDITGIFVLSWARVVLGVLQQALHPSQLMYSDTDSCYAFYDPDNEDHVNFKHPEKLRAAVAAKMSWVFEDPDYAWTVPVIGKALGEWEVEDEHITKFTSSGAKSKTYVTELPGKEGTEHTHKGLSALSVGQSGVTFEDFAEQVLTSPFEVAPVPMIFRDLEKMGRHKDLTHTTIPVRTRSHRYTLGAKRAPHPEGPLMIDGKVAMRRTVPIGWQY